MEHRWPTGSPRRPLSLRGLSCPFSAMWPSRWTTPAARFASGKILARQLDDALSAAERDGSRSADAPAIISEGEAQALWSRAVELQAMTGVVTRPLAPPRPAQLKPGDRRTLTSGYRFEDARAAAVEAGIDERYVARAAAELGFTPASSQSSAPK